MLGKIYITPTSSPEKLKSVHKLVAEALELKVAPDTTSRNALTRLQTALGKAIGETTVKPSRKSSVPEGVTLADQEDAEVEETVLADTTRQGEDIKMEDVEAEGATEAKVSTLEEAPTDVKDSILDELLDDEAEEL